MHGPEQTDIRRRYIEERYKLLPYIYTSVEEMSRTGKPLMRPVFLDYPDAEEFYNDDRDFLFGPDLFVAPVVTEKVDSQGIYLPPGDWYDYWTATVHTNKDEIVLRPTLSQMPLYVRAGAIVPMQPLVQSTNETPNGPLQLQVYSGQNCSGTLYQDDGHSYEYQNGRFLRVNYTCEVAAAGVRVTSAVAKSDYKPWWTAMGVTIYGVANLPKRVRIGEEETHDWRYDNVKHAVTFTVPNALSNWTAQVVY